MICICFVLKQVDDACGCRGAGGVNRSERKRFIHFYFFWPRELKQLFRRHIILKNLFIARCAATIV